MLEEIGVVSSIEKQADSQIICVETQIKSTCGSCEAQSNCGTGAIAKVFANKREKLTFNYQGVISIGQQVKLGIPEQSLLKASSLVYILPIFVLIFSALLAQNVLPLIGLTAELWVIICAFSAAGLSFKGINIYLNQTNFDDYHPKILSVLPLDSKCIQFIQL
jgi:sigma-E factor negative regulatory protein RseC